MEYFPLFINIKFKPCLVVGGGEIALRKTQALLKAQANITVVAPVIEPELQELLKQVGGHAQVREFLATDVHGMVLVIAATDDLDVNKQVSEAAQSANVLVNVVDNPSISTVITPAVIDRDPLIIAIGSAGQAPVLARMLRAKIESLIPARYGDLAKLAGTFREKAKQVFSSISERRRFWEGIMEGPAAEFVLNGNQRAAEQLVLEQLAKGKVSGDVGEVYLVGGGPGDPDLLTFRALRLMQQADVVLYDRLVSPAVLNLVRRDAEKIYVGKRRAEHAVPQTHINQLLVDLAKQGKRVLRLKGGDPFIFGRGGEEIEQLAAEGIPFQVVPGITAASGCASYAGIPLTHRDYAQSVRFITGHLKSDAANLDFRDLIDPNQTLVFYMGLVGLPDICKHLIDLGRSPDTPAALVEKGTTPEQRVFTSTIGNLAADIADKDVHAPTLLIIGGVVSLHERLKWFRT